MSPVSLFHLALLRGAMLRRALSILPGEQCSSCPRRLPWPSQSKFEVILLACPCHQIRAAAVTGRYTYEGLAEFAGGYRAKVNWIEECFGRLPNNKHIMHAVLSVCDRLYSFLLISCRL